MSDKEISEILGEIDELRSSSSCRLVVLQCDAKVQSCEVYEAYEEASFSRASHQRYRLYGRGGTNFRPVFEWILDDPAELDGQPDALIYCTDGYGSFPKDEPHFPVVWIATQHASKNFPFGDVIPLRGL